MQPYDPDEDDEWDEDDDAFYGLDEKEDDDDYNWFDTDPPYEMEVVRSGRQNESNRIFWRNERRRRRKVRLAHLTKMKHSPAYRKQFKDDVPF